MSARGALLAVQYSRRRAAAPRHQPAAAAAAAAASVPTPHQPPLPAADYSKGEYDLKWSADCWWNRDVIVMGEAGLKRDHPVIAFLARVKCVASPALPLPRR